MIDSNKILFIPSLRRGNGSGHLKRCLEWGKKFKIQHVLVYSENGEDLIDYMDHPLSLAHGNIQWHHQEAGSDWSLVVLDNRETRRLPESLRGIPLIALDESGNIRESASYVIDTLPGLKQKSLNLNGYRFISGEACKVSPEKVSRILVSFGGEDESDLSGRLLKIMRQERFSAFLRSSGLQIDIIRPSQVGNEVREESITVFPYIPQLSKKVVNYDLILCQFGLTAFEALSSRRYVFLLNPGEYHDRLSSEAGIPHQAGVRSMGDSRLSKILMQLLSAGSPLFQRVKDNHPKIWEEYEARHEDFESWLLSMNLSRDLCPVCLGSERRVLARFERKSYFLCRDCGMKYMVQFRIRDDIYGKDYFFSEYKAQYGKTYIEDFPHIQEMGRKRLEQIRRISPTPGRLLDVGCAYGPFLKTALEQGYDACGLEISSDAVDYIKKEFRDIQVQQGDLNDRKTRDLFRKGEFDVVSLWYVIEHFSDLSEILPHLSDLLKKGGVLALSTPCASGISSRLNKDEFLRKSPDDHFTLWDRKSARECLGRAGFTVVRFVSTGHHADRFPPVIRKILPPRIIRFISHVMGLGDTFEIYAQKG